MLHEVKGLINTCCIALCYLIVHSILYGYVISDSHYNQSVVNDLCSVIGRLSSPHSSSVFSSFTLYLLLSSCHLSHWCLFHVLSSFLSIDEEWQHDRHFTYSFYLLFTDDFSSLSLTRLKQELESIWLLKSGISLWLLILTLELFWSPDLNHPISVSDWPRV